MEPTAPAAPAASAPAASAGIYAVARIGKVHLAMANAVVLQAVALPERLLVLPRRAGALEGLFSWQGQWVPVLQLNRWVDLGPAEPVPSRDRRILVLREAGRVIGLQVDSVMGVRAVRASELARVHHGEDPDELFQSVIAADGTLPALCVLEPHRLMALAAAWCESAEIKPGLAADTGALSPAHTADTSRHMPYASFRIGDVQVALPAADIGELIPSPPLQSAMPAGSVVRGICTWRGRFVPVVDLGPALGAGVPTEASASVCIVRWGDLAIGLLVDQVGGLQAVDAARIEVRAGPDPHCDVLLGVCVVAGGALLHLLDSARLMACFPETGLSAPRSAAVVEHGGDARCAEAFIVFDAGSPRAAPARQVQEIVSLPVALLARLDAGQAATIEWRGFAVPVVDLRGRVNGTRDMRPAQLVIVAEGDRRAAVTIAGVRELIAARTATRTRISAGPSVQFDMVTVDTALQKLSYAVLDLAQFIEAPRAETLQAA